jgi:hypothetical protein
VNLACQLSRAVPLRAGGGAMMAAKHSLDVVQGGNAFVVRLAVPEHNEAQLANAAMSFGVSVSEPANTCKSEPKEAEAILSP